MSHFITREMRIRLAKRDQYRSDMDKLRQTQELWREKNRREIEEENERIAIYLADRENKLKILQEAEIEKRKKDEHLRVQMCMALNEKEVSYFCYIYYVYHLPLLRLVPFSP